MKKFSQLNEAKAVLDIQEDSINYISAKQLQDYLDITKKFTMQETKNIILWLIENNATYIKTLGKGSTDNALAAFYNAGVPQDETLKELYKWVGTVVKANRTLEIPVFQTEEQFEGILKGKFSLDEIAMDFETEKGKTAIVKKYDALLHKVCNSWVGKSALSYDELISAAYDGMAYAMATYCKKSKKQQTAEADGEEEKDMKKVKASRFQDYLTWCMRNGILGAIEGESHVVRIPKSQQKRMHDEQGFIARSYGVSGDKKIGSDEDGKTLWDEIGGVDNPTGDLTKREADAAFQKLIKAINTKFGDKTSEILANWMKTKDDPTKLSGDEMAAKLGYKSAGSISTEIKKVIAWIQTDKKAYELAKDCLDLVRECRIEDDEYDHDPEEPVHTNLV